MLLFGFSLLKELLPFHLCLSLDSSDFMLIAPDTPRNESLTQSSHLHCLSLFECLVTRNHHRFVDPVAVHTLHLRGTGLDARFRTQLGELRDEFRRPLTRTKVCIFKCWLKAFWRTAARLARQTAHCRLILLAFI